MAKATTYACEVCAVQVPIDKNLICIGIKEASSPFNMMLDLKYPILNYCFNCFEAIAGDEIALLFKNPLAIPKIRPLPPMQTIFPIPKAPKIFIPQQIGSFTCVSCCIIYTQRAPNFTFCVNLCNNCYNNRAQPTSMKPICRKCNAECVLRVNRKYPGSESAFWGCSKYPLCKSTRKI